MKKEFYSVLRITASNYLFWYVVTTSAENEAKIIADAEAKAQGVSNVIPAEDKGDGILNGDCY